MFQKKDTAIPLNQPFTMKIEKGNGIEKTLVLKQVTLLQRSATDDKLFLDVRAATGGGFPDHIGQVVAQRAKIKDSLISRSIGFVSNAFAQNNFDWRGHKNDDRYKEEYVDKNTIRRTYQNGDVLEYKVESDGKVVLSSLKWID